MSETSDWRVSWRFRIPFTRSGWQEEEQAESEEIPDNQEAKYDKEVELRADDNVPEAEVTH